MTSRVGVQGKEATVFPTVQKIIDVGVGLTANIYPLIDDSQSDIATNVPNESTTVAAEAQSQRDEVIGIRRVNFIVDLEASARGDQTTGNKVDSFVQLDAVSQSQQTIAGVESIRETRGTIKSV